MNRQPSSCFLCGSEDYLTFEHIPPRCALNSDLIFVQKHEQMLDKSSPLFGKYSKSHKGFGKFCLCAKCNNNTGNWYAKAFCDFANQGLKILNQNQDSVNYLIAGDYFIQPKNILKQILLMFVSADSAGILRSKPGVVNYILDRNNSNFPEKLNIFLYSNSSIYKRMMGYSFAANIYTGERYEWSEINFRPFGYFLTYDSNPPNQFMVNISKFNEVPYNKATNVEIKLPYLVVSSMEIGTYDNTPLQ